MKYGFKVDHLMNKEKFWAAFSGYDDFFMYNVQDVNGNVVYIGPNIFYNEEEGFRKYTIRMIILAFCMFGMAVVPGLWEIAGMNTIWQVAPMAVEVFFSFWAVLAACRSLFYNTPLKYHEYTATIGTLHKRSGWVALGAAIGFVSMISYVVPFGLQGKAAITIAYIIAKAASAALSYYVYNETVMERHFTAIKQEKSFDELFGTPLERTDGGEYAEGADAPQEDGHY